MIRSTLHGHYELTRADVARYDAKFVLDDSGVSWSARVSLNLWTFIESGTEHAERAGLDAGEALVVMAIQRAIVARVAEGIVDHSGASTGSPGSL